MGAFISDKSESKILTGLFLLVGSAAVYFVGKKVVNTAKQNNVEKTLATDVNAQAATALRAAFNPSGSSWLRTTDGTNNEGVMQAAKMITDFEAAAKAYKNTYQYNLSDDLTNELTTQELTQFYAIVKANEKKSKAIMDESKYFKYAIGTQVVTSPLPGFKRVAYYEDPYGKPALKILYWHTQPGAYAGTIVKRFRKSILWTDGKVQLKVFYGLSQVPVKNIAKSTILYMIEDEVKPVKK